MKFFFSITLCLFALTAEAQENVQYRVTLKTGNVYHVVNISSKGVDSLVLRMENGSKMTIARSSLKQIGRRIAGSDKSKILGGSSLYIEARPGYFFPQNSVKDFKSGLSYGGSVGYAFGMHSIEGSFDYFSRAVQTNANNQDTLKLSIVALHYILGIDLGGNAKLNIGAGPCMVFFSRQGVVTGFAKSSKPSGSILAGASFGWFYFYGRYVLPFTYSAATQLPTSSIKYGGYSAQVGVRF